MALKIKFIRTAEEFRKAKTEIEHLQDSFEFELPNHSIHIVDFLPKLTGDGDVMVEVTQSLKLNKRERSFDFSVNFPAENLPDFIAALERLNDKLNQKEDE